MIQVKRNQPTLFDTLTGWASAEPPLQTHSTSDSGRRQRIESRHAAVWPLPSDVTAQLSQWPGIKYLVRVERSTDLFNSGTNSWKIRRETAWYICTRELTAEQANTLVRSHWAIENSLHYVRDVTMQEDASRIRKQPGVFARLRSWTLNLIHLDGHHQIQAAREAFAWNAQAAWDCLNGVETMLKKK